MAEAFPFAELAHGELRVTLVARDAFAEVEACLKQASRYRARHTRHLTANVWACSLFDELDVDATRALCVVRRDDEPVGVVELVRDDPEQVTIALLVVATRLRLRGVGKGVVALLTEGLKQSGVRRLSLGCAQSNGEALAFWEALGFERVDYLGGRAERLVMMERPL